MYCVDSYYNNKQMMIYIIIVEEEVPKSAYNSSLELYNNLVLYAICVGMLL